MPAIPLWAYYVISLSSRCPGTYFCKVIMKIKQDHNICEVPGKFLIYNSCTKDADLQRASFWKSAFREVGVRKESKLMVDHKVMLLQVPIESKGVKTGVGETRKHHQAREQRIWKWCYKQNWEWKRIILWQGKLPFLEWMLGARHFLYILI